MFLNLFYSTTIFLINYKDYNDKKINLILKKEVNYKTIKKLENIPNIYFFVIDAMMPLDKFENFYEVELNDFMIYILKITFLTTKILLIHMMVLLRILPRFSSKKYMTLITN